MLEVANQRTDRASGKVLARLRASREEFLSQSKVRGAKLGQQWLESIASYEELERLWQLHEQRSAGADARRGLGSAELFLAIHPSPVDLHAEAERFWLETVGVQDELTRNQPEFLEAFVEKVAEQWSKLREQLDEVV